MLANQLSQLARQGCAMAGSVLVVGVVLAGSPAQAGTAARTGTAAQAGTAARTGTAAQAGTAGTRTTRTRTAVHAGAAARRPGTTAASASLDLKRISYRGYTFRVPRSWPIINVAASPSHCVRFDEHAVYLGAAGVNQSCPSWLVGTTEALLIQPGRVRAARTSVEDPVARDISVAARGIRVTATFDADPTVIYRILATASLPAPVIRMPNPARLAAATTPGAAAGPAAPATLAKGAVALGARHAGRGGGIIASTDAHWGRSPNLPRPVTAPALPAQIADYHGLAFDSCAAPSPAYMRAWWRSSPYGAVGIYIGGADRACAEPNLTAGWVRQQAAVGWRFMPLYVGPQAEFGELSSPAEQGRQAAADAVTQAERLGFGPGTPIYYDMEAYPAGQTSAALAFLSAWTTSLHSLGFLSGVYSSSGSGIADLARHYSGHAHAMPDAIYDALWNGAANTADPVYLRGEWADHQRLHQYSGNVLQTYGGDSIDLDQDYLDVDLPAPGGTSQATSAVTLPNDMVEVFYRGTDNSLWRGTYSPRTGWSAPVDMGGTLTSPPSAVCTGQNGVDVFYRGAGGYLWQVAYQPGAGWGRPQELAMMRVLGTEPSAVAQANGVIDVFWKGSEDDHLWHAQYSPGQGWTGPQRLGGSLVSSPSPAESSPGTAAVFWQGTDDSLWETTRRPGGSWSRAARLGMKPLGGPPHATAQPDGEIEVFWRGTDLHHVWAAFSSPAGHWTGPRDLGGQASDAPWPASAGGTVRVFWRGPQASLRVVQRYVRGWGTPARLPLGPLESGPFSAVGTPDSPVVVFWQGSAGALWSSTLARNGEWTTPHSLGGLVG